MYKKKIIKRDKIFDNEFGNHDLSENKINFTVSTRYEDTRDIDDKIHYNLLFEKLDTLITGSEFEHLNKVTPTGVIKKLNKVQINRVFSFVINNIGESYTRVDLFGVISDYFDVFPKKFYNSLSNKYKDELIKELDDKYGILRKRNINKLF
tara:strand:- start:27428 stop:27880 length:453 start_codon:yes stop_codon:yes gene_type:complete